MLNINQTIEQDNQEEKIKKLSRQYHILQNLVQEFDIKKYTEEEAKNIIEKINETEELFETLPPLLAIQPTENQTNLTDSNSIDTLEINLSLSMINHLIEDITALCEKKQIPSKKRNYNYFFEDGDNNDHSPSPKPKRIKTRSHDREDEHESDPNEFNFRL